MTCKEKLRSLISDRKTVVCVGLDSDLEKLPAHLRSHGRALLEFNEQIIEATSDIVCAFKPNIAFYERLGSAGWEILKQTIALIPDDVPVIVDAKRGDIGNTSAMYAKAIFEDLGADGVTLSPYLGEDSLRPFFDYKEKLCIVLCVTSNKGANDFQFLDVGGHPLYQHVAEAVVRWNTNGNLGLVVGAPYPEKIRDLRGIVADLPFLIPGVGAQGGDLESAVRFGTDNGKTIAVVNASRSILYASGDKDFAEKAREEVLRMNSITSALGIL